MDNSGHLITSQPAWMAEARWSLFTCSEARQLATSTCVEP